MSSSSLLLSDSGPSEAYYPNKGSSQHPSKSIPTRPPFEEANKGIVSGSIPSNIDSSQSQGILREGHRQQRLLPAEKVFPVQIGSALFRLSGASITSDGPSYFTRFFGEQILQNEEDASIKTLYIDRDPRVFDDIARHLQGYHVQPADGSHYVRLFADAQFYSLPRLIAQLFESETFVQIGNRHFQVPRDIFSAPGDSPNFFTLGFAAFFSTPQEVFPGLDHTGLLRPPSIRPPFVPSRSAEIFSDILHLLKGYPLHLRNEDHRAELLRDCRYFHLRGLEQKLIAHEISYNPDRQALEILLRLDDVKPSGVSFAEDNQFPNDKSSGGWVHYARPFVDDTARELIVEIGSDPTMLQLNTNQASFRGLTKARVASLLQIVAGKIGNSIDLVPDATVRFEINADTDLILDGGTADAVVHIRTNHESQGKVAPESKKRKLDSHSEPGVVVWMVRKGQWRLRVERDPVSGGTEIVLVAVKLDASTNQRARNMMRKFLI